MGDAALLAGSRPCPPKNFFLTAWRPTTTDNASGPRTNTGEQMAGGLTKCNQKRKMHAAHMAKRGNNLFKRNDGLRALRIARDGGIEPAMIEIVAKDGTVFRVHGKASSTSSEAEQAWDDALTKLQKDKPQKASRSAPTRR
jgi:hypothetical protein